MPLYSAGSNSHGQLGQLHLQDSHEFRPCQFNGPDPPPTHVRRLAFGANHTLALCSYRDTVEEELQLWVCGSNERGQLGPAPSSSSVSSSSSFIRLPLGDLLSLLSPQERQEYRLEVLDECRIISIACAWETSYILVRPNARAPDVVLALGANDWDERALPTPSSTLPSINIISFDHIFFGEVPSTHDSSPTRILSLAAGPRHVLAIAHQLQSGATKVVGWGASRHGQLASSSIPDRKPLRTVDRPTMIPGLPPFESAEMRPIAIAAGREHSAIQLVTSEQSAVVLLGSNKQGQLDGDPEPSRSTRIIDSLRADDRIDASWTSTFICTAQGRVRSWGANGKGQLGRSSSASSEWVELPEEVEISMLAAGSEHVLALNGRTGDVYGWGWNEHGNLGLSHVLDVPLPRLVWSSSKGRVIRTWCGNATSFLLTSPNESERVATAIE